MNRHPSQRRLVGARAGSNRRLLLLAGGSSRRLSTNNINSNQQMNSQGANTNSSAAATTLTNNTAVTVDVFETYEKRVDRIRHLVVSFLGGRELTEEEEDVLQQDCAALLLQNPLQQQQQQSPQQQQFEAEDVEDHHVARRVVNSLFSTFFMQQEGEELQAKPDDELRPSLGAGRAGGGGRSSSSVHLELEAAQVESMAALKLQAFIRGLLCRRRQLLHQSAKISTNDNTTTTATTAIAIAASSTTTTNQRMPRIEKPKSSRLQRLLSANSQTKADNLSQLLDQVDGTVVDGAAAIILQALIKGFLVRQRRKRSTLENQEPNITSVTASLDKANAEPTQTSIPSQQETSTTSISAEEPVPPPPPPLHERQSSSHLRSISETEAVVDDSGAADQQQSQDTSTRSSRTRRAQPNTQQQQQQQQHQLQAPYRRNLSLLGMQYLNKSQTELSSVTQFVKATILIKLQARVRGFLVRRRRRRLRKEQSIRALQLRPRRTTWQGTPHEHAAATAIQRTLRGYVQRWKYWTAMRQHQLEEIHSLQAKQLRKIEERKKSVMKAFRKQIFFDATSLARQLQRAKRAIKFLVKEERRQIQQNDNLSAQIREFQKTNQLLSNATDTASRSNETLQAEISELEQRNGAFQAKRQEHVQTIKGVTLEWKQVNKDVQKVKQENQTLQSVIERVRKRAGDFLKEHHPDLLADETTAAANSNPKSNQGNNHTKKDNNGSSSALDCRA